MNSTASIYVGLYVLLLTHAAVYIKKLASIAVGLNVDVWLHCILNPTLICRQASSIHKLMH